MKCFQCNKEINEINCILISADSDFVCSKECELKFKKERDIFLNEIVQDPIKCKNWLLSRNQ